ncbi:hypothetical protein DPMN_146286 [Dreissena polymorpha]|uniref:Uncharacterized protein n=1 Tax=Dreissena polymorpha TaxID=45954 RepID=A0A9D4J267_DREPO|nr:hypothetical protein DPMN_146286 [Dreissena polymorpha]
MERGSMGLKKKMQSNVNILTLTRDGNITASLQDPAFRRKSNVRSTLHVAATGQWFVLCEQYLSQVYTDGKTVLNTIQLHGSYRSSIFFNEGKCIMIVGRLGHYAVIKFQTNVS